MTDSKVPVPPDPIDKSSNTSRSITELIGNAINLVTSTRTYQQLGIRLAMLSFLALLGYIFFVDNLFPVKIVGILDDFVPGKVKSLNPKIFQDRKTEIESVMALLNADLVVVFGHLDDRTDVAYFVSDPVEARRVGINIGSPVLIGYTQAFVMRFLQEGLCTSVKTTANPSLIKNVQFTNSVTCPIIGEDPLVGSVTAYYRRPINIEEEQYNLKQVARYILKLNQGKR